MKQTIEHIKSINHHFRHAIEQVGEGVLIIESSSRHPLGPQILFASGRVSELTGYSKGALIDQPIGLIFEPEQLNGLISRLPAVGKTGRIYEMRRDALTQPGGRVRCRWTISGVRNEQGEVVNFILTLSALEKPETATASPPVAASPTADTIVEESMEKSRVESLALLAGGIAHDFNNVLQIVLTNLSLARLETSQANPVRQHLDHALESVQEGQALVRQILDFTKGREPKVEVVNLGDALRRAAKLATMGTQFKCEPSVAEDLWGVEVDVRQIGQVMHNLMVNACQAMPGGGTIQAKVENVRVSSDSRLDLVPGPYVVVRVRDHGCGIPAELQGRIFDPEFTTKPNGNGIGLATCRTIVQRHRGAITVASRENVGSEFRVFLPACQIFEESEPETETRTGDPGATTLPSIVGSLPAGVIPGRGGRVLVVDDQNSVRDAAEKLLRKIGYQPVTAASGQEAVALYRQCVNTSEPFNAVLLDMTLPGGLSGDEVMTEIRKVDGRARVIATSGYFADDAESAFRREGYVGILPKPYAVENLSQKLAEAIYN